MKFNIFLYIVLNFIVLQLLSLQSSVVDLVLNSCCILGIATLGIAHGAIDDILYGASEGKKRIHFIKKYVLVSFIFLIFWLFFSNAALSIFLVISAYHFGQSQFVDYQFGSGLITRILYFLWGALVILFMFCFNSVELLTSQNILGEFLFILYFLVDYSYYLLIVFSVLYIITFLYTIYVNDISYHSIFKEIYILGLVSLSFYILPPFVAFSLFFILIHSLKVMSQEYSFCKEKLNIDNLFQFIKLLLPLTICSLLGTGFIIYGVFYFGGIELVVVSLLVLLSCITLPHSFVMDRFYGGIFYSNSKQIQREIVL